jgi:hypothetical protein
VSPQKAKSVSEGSPSFNAWDVAIGLIACAIVFVFPLFPDEKLVRLKLEALEIGEQRKNKNNCTRDKTDRNVPGVKRWRTFRDGFGFLRAHKDAVN